ncbi:hypothetical protein [Bounagaea algeriensis]
MTDLGGPNQRPRTKVDPRAVSFVADLDAKSLRRVPKLDEKDPEASILLRDPNHTTALIA